MDNQEVSNSPSDTQDRLALLEEKVQEICFRNRRVETDKAWETSRTRLCAVTVVTYITMVLVFMVIGSNKPLLDALVPTTGFFLSTLSLPILRRIWQRNFKSGE